MDVRRRVAIPVNALIARVGDVRIVVVVAIAIFDRTDSNQNLRAIMSAHQGLSP
jgi:hypothetical protein